MSAFYHYSAHQQHPTPAVAPGVSHSHHGGRNRRAPRLSVSQNPHKQFRSVKSMKELTAEPASLTAFRTRFELGRSFDLEDDLEFCPGLLSESDLVSVHSGSERSSLASNSPESSPTQQPTTVASFSLNSTSPAFIPPTFQTQQSALKIHQPAATRARNAIPIINPATGISMSSPPPSVSPAHLQQGIGRRW